MKRGLSSAVITLGGKGTRLNPVTKEIPKSLWLIDGINTLERIIINLNEQGIKNFIWLLGYKYNLFLSESKRLADKYNIKIKIHKEEKILGEAGALLEIISQLDEIFIFVNGDIIFDIDIKRLFKFHLNKNSDITFVTHLTNHPNDSDCISEKENLSINKYKFKGDLQFNNNNMYLGNAGIAIFSKKIVENLKNIYTKNEQLSLFKDFIIKAHNEGFLVFSYNTSEYLKDMGTPKRLESIQKDLKNKLVFLNSYRNSQKVLFLDRDNTLIKCKKGDYILNKEIIFYENRIRKIAEISKDFNFVLLITNQPQISMGLVSYQQVIDINSSIILHCQKLNLNISAAYICPHHPHKGFLNEIDYLKVNCFCRKPLPGNFLEASFNRNILLNESLLIGDSWRDFEAAKNINMNFLDINKLDISSE